jgi:hypothetical protein
MFVLLLTLVTNSGEPAKDHTQENALFKSLRDPGLAICGDTKAIFPVPTMPDGLDAGRQKAIIEGLIKEDYSFAQFMRKSVVAPQLLKLRDVNSSNLKAPGRGVDVWFVTYGELKALDDEKFLERLVNAGKGEGKGKELTKEELAKRMIARTDEKHESYGHIEFDFLEKVHLSATGRVVWTHTNDSVLVAGVIDPRFQSDKEYPNQWQPIIKEGGMTKLGPAMPWSEAGFYLKITKLSDPAGALFIEQHIIFAEPTGWFDGANLLRSKLPIAVQSNVRSMRKEWAKKSEGK